MSPNFDISKIVSDVGENFTMSGVAVTHNQRGDPTESFTDYNLTGVIQVMDGTEDEVQEGLLEKEDIQGFVDANADNVGNIKANNYITTETITSGIFRVVNVMKNDGHTEFHAKKVHGTAP